MFNIKHTYNYIAFGNMDDAGGTRREDNTPPRSFWCQDAQRREYTNVIQKLDEKIETEKVAEKEQKDAAKKAEETQRKKDAPKSASLPRSHGLIIKVI